MKTDEIEFNHRDVEWVKTLVEILKPQSVPLPLRINVFLDEALHEDEFVIHAGKHIYKWIQRLNHE